MKFIVLMFCGVWVFDCCQAVAVPIAITQDDFYVSDMNFVEFGPSINGATLYEDESSGFVLISNDPFFGEPGIIVPDNAHSIRLDLEFSTTGYDSFEVLLLDSSGGYPYFSFFHDGSQKTPGEYTCSGVTIDLISLGLYAGSVVGLEFSLTSNFGNPMDTSYDATLHISNAIFDTDVTEIPEPSTLILLITGMLYLIFWNKYTKYAPLKRQHFSDTVQQ